MSRDVLTVGSTMRIPLLYRGEYSQWVERFMNYLEEQTDGEAMINSIKNGDQPLPRVTQVSIAGTSSTEQPPLEDKSMWSDQEKKIQKIDHLASSLLIQGLPNDIYSLIDSNKIAKDLWDALARHMLGSEYGEQDRKAANKNLMDINIDALYNILNQNQGDVNDDMGLKKKTIVVTSNPLALIAEKTKVSKRKEKVVVSSDSEGSGADDFSELKKITALKDISQKIARKSKLRIVKDYEYYKTKILLAKKDKDKQVLLAEDQAWMESSSDSDQEINANMVFMAQIQKVLSDSEVSSSFADDKISKRIEKANQQNKDFENQNKDLQDKYDVLKNQATTFEMNNKELNEKLKVLIVKNDDLLAQTKVKKIDDQEVLYDKMSVQLVELDKHVRDLKNTVSEKNSIISELEECVHNKDLEIGKCLKRLNVYENKLHKMGQTNQTVHMIMPSMDTLYNGQKGIGFENPSYFEKAKNLRPSLYDEKVIGLGYTLIFLTHSDEALEIEKFKRARENKIEFAYDYGSLNASYVNEKINFSDDYFQEIINPDFDKIDSPFQ
nr:DUF4219 domain-containing protein/UBN2 domain-containing protein [Tanacetum cinerariifolium]